MHRRKPMKVSGAFPKKSTYKRGRTGRVVVSIPQPVEPGSKRVLFLCSVFCSRALKDYLVLTKNGFDVFVGHIGGKNKHIDYIKNGRSIVYMMNRENIKKTIRNVKPNIIHVHNSPNIPAVWARDYFTGPIILDIHDSRKKDQQNALDLVDYVYTVHDDYANKTIKPNFKVNTEIQGIPSVYWIDFQPEAKFDDGEIHLCFIGSMYGPPTAKRWCEMFKKLANRLKIHIHIHVNYFHDIVKGYADDYVHMEEQISFMDIPRVLSRYDAGIIPPGSAMSLPNKFFDYVNAGVPILVEPGRDLVSQYVKKYQLGVVGQLDKLAKADIKRAVSKQSNVDYTRIDDIKTVVDVEPYSSFMAGEPDMEPELNFECVEVVSVDKAKLIKAVQSKAGSCFLGKIHFYDYTTTSPKRDKINIPYIRDLPSVQGAWAGFPKTRIDMLFAKFNNKVRNIDGFVAMTDRFADQIRETYSINVPYGIFMAYPSWFRAQEPKRREIVYIDNSGTSPIAFRQHLDFLSAITKATGIPTLFVSKKFNAEAQKLVKERQLAVRCRTLQAYDYGSEFGILMDTNNFNQTEEAMPRKFLTYLMCNMKPIVHGKWTSVIEYAESHDIHPYTFTKPEGIKLDRHKFGEWEGKFFSMQERIDDLIVELNRVGGVVGKPAAPEPKPLPPVVVTGNGPPLEAGLRTFKSPRLMDFPDRVVFITDKNYADIGDKMVACLRRDGIDARFINANRCNMDDPFVKDCFNMNHSRILVIFYDPGNTSGTTSRFTQNIGIPRDVSWGLLRGSSYYRVTNLELEWNTIMRKGGRRPLSHRDNSARFARMKRANKYFDSQTPLVMCGTECLLNINPKSVFLGQPQPFSTPFDTKKRPRMIGHITAPVTYNDVKKGTGRIQKAFEKIDFMETKIIGCPRVSRQACDAFVDGLGISVITMTTWDSGLGYVGLESLEASCLCMSSLPKGAKLINSPIIHVGKPDDVVEQARYYHDNVREYNKKRKQQYEWGKQHFSYKAIANRFRAIVQNVVDNRWIKVDKSFRGLADE